MLWKRTRHFSHWAITLQVGWAITLQVGWAITLQVGWAIGKPEITTSQCRPHCHSKAKSCGLHWIGLVGSVISGSSLLQFARWLSEAKLHGAWCGKTYNNTTIVIPTMLQHSVWHKSSAPYCMHFDNQLANCNIEMYCAFHISCPDSKSKREGISIVLVYLCKL